MGDREPVPGWERVPATGRLTFWRKPADKGSRLIVAKGERGWVWRHEGPRRQVLAKGTAPTEFQAKIQADNRARLSL